MLLGSVYRCGGAPETTAWTRSRLGFPAPRRALAQPELTTGTWCPSVCLRRYLPEGTAGLRVGWGGHAEREKRGRRPPSKSV